MLYFKELEIEGFGSFQIPFVFRLDHPGLTAIKAPNGTGKTTILSALSWVCTGYPLKEGATIETWERLRTNLWRGTRVRVVFEKFDDTYEAIRCKDFTGKVQGSKGKNRLILLKNGQEIGEAKSKGKAKEMLQEILGFSYGLFKSALAMGQKVKGLVEEDNSSRVKIFEEAFDVAYINKAKEIGKTKLKNEREKLSKLESELLGYSSKQEGKEELLESLKEQSLTFDTNKKKQIKKLKAKIEEAEEKLKSCVGNKVKWSIPNSKIIVIDKSLKSITKAKDKRRKLETQLARLNGSLKFEERTYESIKKERDESWEKLQHIPTSCMECGKPYTKSERKQREGVLKANHKALETSLKITGDTITKSKSEINELTQQIASKDKLISKEKQLTKEKKVLEKQRDSFNSNEGLRSEYESQIKEYKSEIKVIKKEKFTGDISKVEKQIEKLKEEVKPIKKLARKSRKLVEDLEWCINDPLSNHGIKAFIFDQMMGDFNDLLLEYADILGFQVKFEVNMDSARKSIDAYILKNGMEIPQKDLSGGQGQLVNIAAAFALHDVVNKVLNTNILFIDEAFESLDAHNIEVVSEIIQKKAETKSVTLITHQKSFAPTNARMLALRLHQGVTQYDRP